MSDDSEFSEQIQVGWINWFCNLEDHNFLTEVDQAFIRDSSNLYGLRSRFPRYDEALNMILRHRPPSEVEIEDPKQFVFLSERFLELYQIATELYGLIHARYIQTSLGLALMRQRYLTGKFGNCPRVMCENQNVIPVGMSTDCKLSRVKIYCPRCRDIYNPKKKFADVDGAFFGPSFPYLLLMTYPDLGALFKKEQFAPTMFGFKIEEPNPESVVRIENLNKLKNVDIPEIFNSKIEEKMANHINHEPVEEGHLVLQAAQKNKKNKKKR